MSDITINNDKNQDENQKTTPVTESSLESNSSSIYSPGDVLQIWLGWRDSNPRMLEPEPSALPLGDIPLYPTGTLLKMSSSGSSWNSC